MDIMLTPIPLCNNPPIIYIKSMALDFKDAFTGDRPYPQRDVLDFG